MTCVALPSIKIAEIRNKLKQHVHGGVWLSSEAIYSLITELNSAHALAIEVEDEKQILERHQRLGMPVAVKAQSHASNVVTFPSPKPRLAPWPSGHGGDAA